MPWRIENETARERSLPSSGISLKELRSPVGEQAAWIARVNVLRSFSAWQAGSESITYTSVVCPRQRDAQSSYMTIVPTSTAAFRVSQAVIGGTASASES